MLSRTDLFCNVHGRASVIYDARHGVESVVDGAGDSRACLAGKSDRGAEFRIGAYIWRLATPPSPRSFLHWSSIFFRSIVFQRSLRPLDIAPQNYVVVLACAVLFLLNLSRYQNPFSRLFGVQMANPRQRRKARSGNHRAVRHSNHAKKNLKKQPRW